MLDIPDRARRIMAARSMFETYAPYGINVDKMTDFFVEQMDAEAEEIDPVCFAEGFVRDNA